MSWGVGALAVALIIVLLRVLTPNFFWKVFTPVFRTADAVASGSHLFIASFGNTAALTVQNEKLMSENLALTAQNQSLSQKLADIGALAPEKSDILAGVVTRPPESAYDTLVLSAGTHAGVAVGQEAFGPGGVPIGVISSASADFSRVMLFSAPGVATAGWVGKGIPLTIQGVGGGALQATIARSAGVAVGDTVFVPGPGQLPIGKVARVDGDPSAPSVTLHIESVVNLFSVTWVLLRDTGATFTP